jgi:hypothetical protein
MNIYTCHILFSVEDRDLISTYTFHHPPPSSSLYTQEQGQEKLGTMHTSILSGTETSNLTTSQNECAFKSSNIHKNEESASNPGGNKMRLLLSEIYTVLPLHTNTYTKYIRKYPLPNDDPRFNQQCVRRLLLWLPLTAISFHTWRNRGQIAMSGPLSS